MRTVTLGTTGAEVSALCLGAMYLGTKQDEALSYALLDQYVEAGGTFIDTANIYAHWISGFKGGESEALLGRWMKARGNRDRLFVASKVGFEYSQQPRGLTAEQIITECERSLKRLDIETIDLYYAHKDDESTPLEESLEAFDRLVQAGKVRHLGASNYSAWRLEKARWTSRVNGWAEFGCIQQRYTYIRTRRGQTVLPQLEANEDLLAYCKAEGVTLLAYSALMGGAYTRTDREIAPEYQGPDTDNRLVALRDVAREQQATRNQIVLAWMLAHGVLPLIAASSHEQMAENLGALEITLSEQQLARLDAAGW
ncbi:MAG: aldo/keto reductase [Anaerolineae bacterium]|nr:aldo/keto reductase [Anaerolineae bacterium]